MVHWTLQTTPAALCSPRSNYCSTHLLLHDTDIEKHVCVHDIVLFFIVGYRKFKKPFTTLEKIKGIKTLSPCHPERQATQSGQHSFWQSCSPLCSKPLCPMSKDRHNLAQLGLSNNMSHSSATRPLPPPLEEPQCLWAACPLLPCPPSSGPSPP